MTKNNLKVGTGVTFYPVDGAAYSAIGTIIHKGRKGPAQYTVRVVSGTGAGKDWVAGAGDIIAWEPKPGAWGPK